MQSKIGALVGLCVIGVGGILLITGIATPEWVKGDSIKFGLWELCITFTDSCVSISDNRLTDAFKAVRAFAVLALLASIACGVCALAHVVMGMQGRGSHKILPLICVFFGVVTFFFSLIAISIFAGKLESSGALAYSFFLTILGGAVTAAGSIIVFVVGKEGNMA